MADDYSNDDVFSDDDDNGSSSSGPMPQPQPTQFSEFQAINIGGGQIPGFLVEALEKYLRQNGSLNRNTRIPISASFSSEVHGLAHKIHCHNEEEVASAALFQVVDEISGGMLSQRYEKLRYEDKLVGFYSLLNFINLMYANVEPLLEENLENTNRVAVWLRVFVDILQYHIDSYTDDYLTFCAEEGIDPDVDILNQHGWSHTHPYLGISTKVHRIANASETPLKESLIEFYDHLLQNAANILSIGISTFDRNKV